jgi:predicted small lipoprotein YifL
MRAIATAILLCALLAACGSKGALIMPPKPGTGQQQSDNIKKS